MTTGIVIGNLGTPQAPTPQSVKKYLKQFLMDAFVIDKPWAFRALLVYGIIVPFRARKSAHAYSLVWGPEGSPLMALTEKLTNKLRAKFGSGYQFEIGMRYGEPSIESALLKLKNCERILLCPQYPQYAESSYRTWMEDAVAAVKRLGLEDKVISMAPFYADENYLQALTNQIRKNLEGRRYDHLLFSFHGLPERHMTKIDQQANVCLKSSSCCDSLRSDNRRCYRAQCYAVIREVGRRLSLDPKTYSVAFQSRLGRDPWIQPFTDQMVAELPQRQGVKSLVMAMPAFTVDCLETLEEIHMRAKEDFEQAGGESFHAIPCLNDDDGWVDALSGMIENSLASPVKPCPQS